VSNPVLDASAILALLNQEAGAEMVATFVAEGAAVSAVNLAEVVAKLGEAGLPEEAIETALASLGLEIVDFDVDLAYRAARLRPTTQHLGLSLGDRACLALAQARKQPVVTADRSWATVPIGVPIQPIR